MRHLALVLAVVCTACAPGEEPLPEPRALPLPAPDGVAPLRVKGPLSPRIASYRIAARLDVEKKQVTGTVQLTWQHTGQAPVREAPLHLYLNAFKNETTLFMTESRGEHRRARITPGEWGWIDVSSIRRGDAELRPRGAYGGDETLLWVPMDPPVVPGETLVLDMTFEARLPKVFARTGYHGRFFMVGQWFPKIGVLERGAGGTDTWAAEEFHVMSEFYADFGTYDVTLDVPDTHVIAATGVLTAAEPLETGRRRLTYRAEDVHDFAFMADPHMQVMRAEAKPGVEVRVYYRPAQEAFARRHLDAGIQAIEQYSELLVPYPWPIMTVIDPPPEAAPGAGGMEYPMIVTTAGDSAFQPLGINEPEVVTVHEIGHNWFQGILASNEVESAWLDEGVNDYFNGVVMDAWKGADRSMADWGGFRIGYYRFFQMVVDAGALLMPIATPSYRFPTFSEYGATTYIKTALALKTLEQIVGRERFLAGLRSYAKRYAFQHPTPQNFFDTLSQVAGQDLAWYFEPAIHEPGSVDLRVARLETRKVRPPRGLFGDRRGVPPPNGSDASQVPVAAEGGYREVKEEDAVAGKEWLSEILLVNRGQVPVRAEIELELSSGRVERRVWDGRDGLPYHWLRVRGPHPVVGVKLDPDHEVLLEGERVENGVAPGSLGPSARAAARVAFWEQTLLQLVGL